jgi:3-oxoacyl-[acyl-carrier protein] reductase
MDLGLTGRRALVTGGSKGIGLASAKVLAREGCDVVLVSRTQADLARARDEIGMLANVSVKIEALDLSKDDAHPRLVDRHSEMISSSTMRAPSRAARSPISTRLAGAPPGTSRCSAISG